MIRIGIFVLALFGFVPVPAGEPLADLSIKARIEPNSVIPPGTQGSVSITITNHGPEVGSAFFRWTRTDNGQGSSYPPLEFPGPVTGLCGISPIGQPPPGDFFAFWVTRDILPGESRTCTFGFRVLETKALSQIASWDVTAIGGVEDPNEANDVSEALLIFSVLAGTRPVPVLSWVGLLALILLIALVAFHKAPTRKGKLQAGT